MYRWLKYLIAASSVALVAACGGGDDDDPPPTVASVAAANGFTALVAAAQKAGLVDELSDRAAELTVFAPTNDAFNTLATTLGFADATAMVNALDAATLEKILTYHVLPARKTAAQLAAGNEPTLYAFEGAQATLAIGTTGGVTVTDEVRVAANVTTPDVAADNGVIHVIDKVLVPPGVLNVVQMAQLNPAFSVLVEAVVEAGLADDLSGAGPFTVFAPTNDAFTAFLELKNLVEDGLLALTDLVDVLRYHVLPDDLRAAEVIAAAPTTVGTLFTGKSIGVSGSPSLTLTDLDSGTPDATLLITDIRASNGVIHVINNVLSPFSPDD